MLRNLLRLSRPLLLGLAALTYILGAGVARYLGIPVRFDGLFFGLLWVLLLFLSANMLDEYFRTPAEPLVEGETPRQRAALRITCLQASAAALTVAAALMVLMLYFGLLVLPAVLFLALIVLASLAYAVPPLRLVNTGFGELILAILLADLIPALAFLLQTSEPHRLLAMITFPLTLLALAFFLVLNFPTYAADLKYVRRTLLFRIGWQRAIPLHHVLVLAAYLFFAAAPWLGFPWNVVWPAFLSLPFGIVQILWLRNVSMGGRPLWKFLTANAAVVFGLTAYLLALTFWIR